MGYLGLSGSIDDVISRYGADTASGMIASIKRLPPTERGSSMKAAMANVDSTLQRRAQTYALAAQARGASSAQALEQGLARALSEGVVDELARLGSGRATPKPGSLLGLGLSGPDDLGAGDVTKDYSNRRVQVGPFTFPVGEKPFVLVDGAKALDVLPGSMSRAIRRALVISQREADQLAPAMAISGDLTKKLLLQKAPTSKFWQDVLGIRPTETVTMRAISPRMTEGKWSDDDDGRAMPIATFDHPVSGNKWGIFFSISGPKERPYSGQLYVKWLPQKPWYARAFSWLASLPAKIINAIGDAIEWVKDHTCDLVNKIAPIAQQAGAAPDPRAQAVAAGAQIATSLCAPPPPPPPPPQSSSMLMWLLLAGGGVLVLALAANARTAGKKSPP
jgi:hypothetical protein